MPIYDYTCSVCHYNFENQLPIDNRKQPCVEKCPACKLPDNVTQQLSAVPLGDPVRMGHIKPPAQFNEVLREIKKENPGSNFDIRD